MRRIGFLLAVFAIWAGEARSQNVPISNRPNSMIAPAIDGAGGRVVFGSAIAPDGSVSNAVGAYVAGVDGSNLRRLANFAPGPNAISISPDGARLAYTTLAPVDSGSREQVHVIDTATGADRAVA